jgi:hypothetical protein
MDPRLEQLLLAQAANEAEQGPRLGDSVAAAAALGGGLGVLGGSLAQPLGNTIGKMRGTNHMLKPGIRMAGGLVGAILGGGLGIAAQQNAIAETGRTGELLAELQAQEAAGKEMTPDQQFELQQVLKAAYARDGIIS